MACGGSLSDEQRKRLHEGMKDQKIVKLSDAEIVSAALEQGQEIFSALEKKSFSPSQMDSLSSHYQVKIKWLVPGAGNMREMESQIIDAYLMGEGNEVQDNIQKIRAVAGVDAYDSLLYSKPVVVTMADGIERINGVWNVYMAKKDVVRLAIEK